MSKSCKILSLALWLLELYSAGYSTRGYAYSQKSRKFRCWCGQKRDDTGLYPFHKGVTDCYPSSEVCQGNMAGQLNAQPNLSY